MTDLNDLLRKAARHKMTPEEAQTQRESWVRGIVTPWNILSRESVKVRDSNGGTIASMGHLTRPHQGPRRSFDEVKCNAALIALAPDMARLCIEQADRIEELEAKLAMQEALMDAGFAEYERRLAKAVEALKFYAEADNYEDQDRPESCGCCYYLHDAEIKEDQGAKARTAIAELTGVRDE